MTEFIYLTDAYMKELEAVVVGVDGTRIILDKCLFYPESGGQPTDFGWLENSSGEKFEVKFVKKKGSEAEIEVDKEGLSVGDVVLQKLDWERRYKLMRMHTAAHLLSSVIFLETKAKITGNQLGLNKSRIDFNLEEFNREQINKFEEKANEFIKQEIGVKINSLPRAEAFQKPGLLRLKMFLPESIKEIRFTDFDFDQIACGGTHVKNLSEIGKIKILKLENKGKNNRRIYFEVLFF